MKIEIYQLEFVLRMISVKINLQLFNFKNFKISIQCALILAKMMDFKYIIEEIV